MELANHFTAVTNQSPPLSLIDIPKVANEGLTRLITEKQVEQRLKKIKKPHSRVDGDIPRDVVGPAARALSVSLTLIYNLSLIHI